MNKQKLRELKEILIQYKNENNIKEFNYNYENDFEKIDTRERWDEETLDYNEEYREQYNDMLWSLEFNLGLDDEYNMGVMYCELDTFYNVIYISKDLPSEIFILAYDTIFEFIDDYEAEAYSYYVVEYEED